jgi:6-phosphofructokinase 2
MKIATLTMNPAIDKSSAVDQVVAEWKLRCEPPTYEPGGGGLNVSRAIRKLGGDSLALYAAGGFSGQVLSDLLDQEGLNHQAMAIAGLTRENFTVLEKSTGQQYRFGMPGPTVQEAEWRRCLEEICGLLPQVEYLVASGRLPPGVPANFYGRRAPAAPPRPVRCGSHVPRQSCPGHHRLGLHHLGDRGHSGGGFRLNDPHAFGGDQGYP